METHKRVEEWAKRMGYKGKIPDCLKNVCGPSTTHIWEQLITNVRPKQEIEQIRKNIIVHKLREKKENRARRNDVPIKDILAYEKRERLTSEISGLQDDVAEKVRELEGLEKRISVKNIAHEKLREKIKEAKRKTFLYRKKSEQLEGDVPTVRAKLDFAVSVTPTEGERDGREITETLRKCAEKIKRGMEKDDWNTTVISDTTIGYGSDTQHKGFLSETDDEFSADIKAILCGNNFNVTSEAFSKLVQGYKMNLADAVSEKSFSEPRDRDNSEALNELYAADVENNLLAIKYDREISALNEELDGEKEEIFVKFSSLSPDQAETSRDIFLLRLKEAGLSAMIDALKQMLTASTDDNGVPQELNGVQLGCVEMHKKLETSIRKINTMLDRYKRVHQSIRLCQSDTKRRLHLLRLLTGDLNWLKPLSQNLNAKEVRTFRRFDLGYNRTVNLNGTEVFVRSLLNASGVDPNHLQTIRTLTNRVDASPEEVFFHLLQAKRRLEVYRAQVSTTSNAAKYDRHSLDDLEQREISVNNLQGQLEGTLKEYMASTPQDNVAWLERTMGFWLEMPVKDFVAPDRRFDGQNLGYYQKLYDNMYNNL